jgi:hypothetical protein
MSDQTMTNRVLHEQIILERIGRYDVAQHRPAARPLGASHRIKTLTLLGLLLMIAGFALLAYQGIRYTLEMQSAVALSSGATSRQINLPLSPLVGITAMFAGYVLIVRERD